MAEEKEEPQDPNADPSQETEGKEKTDEKPTLESVTKQIQEQKEMMDRVLKQNSDKDAFISKLQNENKGLRGQIEKVSSTLTGKTEKQKDEVLEKIKKGFIEDGYEEKAVDRILDAIIVLSDKKASEKVVPIVLDTVEELISSDTEIDQKLFKEFEQEIWNEYHEFKPELTPRKIKSNFKKAYKMVKDKHAEKAKADGKAEGEKEREGQLRGAGAPPKGKDTKTEDFDKEFVDSIEKSGAGSSRFV